MLPWVLWPLVPYRKWRAWPGTSQGSPHRRQVPRRCPYGVPRRIADSPCPLKQKRRRKMDAYRCGHRYAAGKLNRSRGRGPDGSRWFSTIRSQHRAITSFRRLISRESFVVCVTIQLRSSVMRAIAASPSSVRPSDFAISANCGASLTRCSRGKSRNCRSRTLGTFAHRPFEKTRSLPTTLSLLHACSLLYAESRQRQHR